MLLEMCGLGMAVGVMEMMAVNELPEHTHAKKGHNEVWKSSVSAEGVEYC